MSKMNYLTGYLPYVSDRDYQRKQIRRRIVLATGLTILAIFLLFFWGTITSAQDSSLDPITSKSHSSQLQITTDRPIWTSLAKSEEKDKTLILAKNSVGKNAPIKEKVISSSEVNQLPISTKTTETSQTLNQDKNMQSADEIGAAYNKDLEILLNKAFSN